MNTQNTALQLADDLDNLELMFEQTPPECAQAAAELRRLVAENQALRKCAIKYLDWLGIRGPETALEGDITDPEMLA